LKRVKARGREYLLLEAVEKPPLEVSGAISYTTDEGFSLELNTHLNDVFKTGERIGVGFYLGQKRQTYEINYFDNYFFSHHYFVGLSIFKKFEEHRDFDLNSKGFSATFGRHLNLYTDLSVNFLWNDFKLTNFPLRGKETKYILNLQFNYPIYVGPFRKGGLTNFASLSYSPNFGGFEKFENKFGLYLNLRKLFIGNKLSFGAVSKNAPPFEKFYLGGLKDLKGYTYEAIAPYGGGSYYWYYGFEVGIPVVSSIYLFTGFDTGNSVNNAKELFKNVKSDAFLGAGTVSALGPIRFGVAFPYENNRFKLKDFKIFMSVGFQF
jgi:outer membrane protein insertion porin family